MSVEPQLTAVNTKHAQPSLVLSVWGDERLGSNYVQGGKFLFLFLNINSCTEFYKIPLLLTLQALTALVPGITVFLMQTKKNRATQLQ